MNRIGLALSGGGFRATVYHLGVLRFLRDANVLHRVSHITSVSGGSITAAHLVTNWDRYTGSEEQFDEAAGELLDFIKSDLRNRIVRRFPLAWVANTARGVLRMGRSRRLTRPGLLEAQYEKHLFGDKCLYELPDSPQLHMLATNINEGCICSFTKGGILDETRLPNSKTRFESVPSAMATIPMGVAASSAFPGFFPPLKLDASDVGADEGKFPPHVFTDGGVYDNLGVRMFQHIQHSWIGQETPLRTVDLVDAVALAEALNEALKGNSTPALEQLAQLVLDKIKLNSGPRTEIQADDLAASLSKVISHDRLYADSRFSSLKVGEGRARELLALSEGGKTLSRGDHHWLNRILADRALEDATGAHLLNSIDIQFDAVIVSDAGKEFYISRQTKGGGLVGTALRSSDILMDRVWKLEVDHFATETGFLFVPISQQVSLEEDSRALHPELQRQVAVIRTDLDRFTDLEISGLVRHGYGLMRKACRSRPDLFGTELPDGDPWDPTPVQYDRIGRGVMEASRITAQARKLQASAQRKVFSTLLDWRDWPTYVYVPLLLFLFFGLPFFAWKAYQKAHRSSMIVDAITMSNPDWQLVLELARQKPIPGDWLPMNVEEVAELAPPESSGFRLVTDTRILDMRAWDPSASNEGKPIVSYRRMQVRRTASDADLTRPSDKFSFQQFAFTNDILVRCGATDLMPSFRIAPHVEEGNSIGYMCEAEFDLSGVPLGEDFDVGFEVSETGVQGREQANNRLRFQIVAPTDVATMWVLLPRGRPYRDFELFEYDPNFPVVVDAIEPTYSFELADGSLFGWMLVGPKDETLYECRWNWRYE